MSGTSEPIGFKIDIKPLFREGDRKAMLSAFDLWSHADERTCRRNPAGRRHGYHAVRHGLARLSRSPPFDAGSRPANLPDASETAMSDRLPDPRLTLVYRLEATSANRSISATRRRVTGASCR